MESEAERRAAVELSEGSAKTRAESLTQNREGAERELIAFPLGTSHRRPHLVPAPRWRQWMNETEARWANRCLPLLMANEAGWVLLNPHAFTATWDGGSSTDALTIELGDAHVPVPRPESNFGYGIITWMVPYLFRTPPGYNLLVRGPANWPKDGVTPLEGLVETDWSVATFTMNWKLTRPNWPVTFEVDEPFCMLVPMRRGELRSFQPQVRDIRSDPETCAGAEQFAEGRHELAVQKFLGQYARDFESERLAWQRHYFRGVTPAGTPAPEHETTLGLPPFDGRDG